MELSTAVPCPHVPRLGSARGDPAVSPMPSSECANSQARTGPHLCGAPAGDESACWPAVCSVHRAAGGTGGWKHADRRRARVSMEDHRMNHWQRIASLVTLSVVVGLG